MDKASKPIKIDKSRNIAISEKPNQSRESMIAESAMNNIVNSAKLTVDFSRKKLGELSLNDCIMELAKKTRKIHKGNLQDAETLLIAQAFALDAIFMSLARLAQMNMGDFISAADFYMRLALKAQMQCRATIETLVNIKNPPVVVARQANIASGPQQVNNTVNKVNGGVETGKHLQAGLEKNL